MNKSKAARLLAAGIVSLLALAACGQTPPAGNSSQPASSTATAIPATLVSTTVSRPTLDLPAVTVEALTPFSVEVAPVTPVFTEPALPDQNSNPFVKQARDDLAARLGIDPAQITLIEFRDVTWPDSSLGCPHPDMGYLQVLMDGYLIRLGVGKQVYEYHGGGGRAPFLCENPVN
jgi:hypothetical protein